MIRVVDICELIIRSNKAFEEDVKNSKREGNNNETQPR